MIYAIPMVSLINCIDPVNNIVDTSVEISRSDIMLVDLLSDISSNYGAEFEYHVVRQIPIKQIHFSGTLGQFLDKIQSSVNIYYEINKKNNHIVIRDKLETSMKIYTIITNDNSQSKFQDITMKSMIQSRNNNKGKKSFFSLDPKTGTCVVYTDFTGHEIIGKYIEDCNEKQSKTIIINVYIIKVTNSKSSSKDSNVLATISAAQSAYHNKADAFSAIRTLKDNTDEPNTTVEIMDMVKLIGTNNTEMHIKSTSSNVTDIERALIKKHSNRFTSIKHFNSIVNFSNKEERTSIRATPTILDEKHIKCELHIVSTNEKYKICSDDVESIVILENGVNKILASKKKDLLSRKTNHPKGRFRRAIEYLFGQKNKTSEESAIIVVANASIE